MKPYAKSAVVLACLLASSVAFANSTPKDDFNAYTLGTLSAPTDGQWHNVANDGNVFTDLITFELATGSTYDLSLTAKANGYSPSQKFSSFSFALYSGTRSSLSELNNATLVATGSFTSVLSATGLTEGSYTLAVTGQAKSNGAQYRLDLTKFTATAIASKAPVAAVPEPETYAMLVAGLGLMAGVARRRSKNAA